MKPSMSHHYAYRECFSFCASHLHFDDFTDLALQEDPPADEDQLLSLAPWLPRACPELSAATVNALVTRGKLPRCVREWEEWV
ncbi:hypothetical protein E2C01_000117 [Portunus trituberculatus]|uniref:Uncharacterized protein n=1 Tax=Portunus trituberculatus TaxID=210409 RepID=A0A5B7CE24_PORTR|nr:hypothetical protein [Portunus trituberculatus]